MSTVQRPTHTSPPDDTPARTSPTPNCLTGVGMIVVDATGRVLLGLGHNGNWELPGGKVDAGESFEAAGVRELKEETGLLAPAGSVRVVALLMDYAYDLNRVTAAAVTEAAEGTARVTEPDKIVRWAWFVPEELPAALFVPSAAVLRAWRPELPLPQTASHCYRLAD
ncbi:NUDIX hydrolase [Streptomyces sp. NPDC058657]|uniref:nucleotide triphosphate diphosphatase NUDT15 n=1 Tax=unclassified Streptomyces TaxID=2593676 RepID=UPI003667477E